MKINKNSWHYRAQVFTFDKVYFDHLCPYFHMSWLALVLAPFVLIWKVVAKIRSYLIGILNVVITRLGDLIAPLGNVFAEQTNKCNSWNENKKAAKEAKLKAEQEAETARFIKGFKDPSDKAAFQASLMVAVSRMRWNRNENPPIPGQTNGSDFYAKTWYRTNNVFEINRAVEALGKKWIDYFDPSCLFGYEKVSPTCPDHLYDRLLAHLWENAWAEEYAAYTQACIDRKIKEENAENKRKMLFLNIAKVLTIIGQTLLGLGLLLIVFGAGFLAYKLLLLVVANISVALTSAGISFGALTLVMGVYLLDRHWGFPVSNGIACGVQTMGSGVKWTWSKATKPFPLIGRIISWPFRMVWLSLCAIDRAIRWMLMGILDLALMLPKIHENICPKLDFEDETNGVQD